MACTSSLWVPFQPVPPLLVPTRPVRAPPPPHKPLLRVQLPDGTSLWLHNFRQCVQYKDDHPLVGKLLFQPEGKRDQW